LNHSFFRTLLFFLSIINLLPAFGQENKISDSLSFLSKKNTAIRSAKTYLENKFLDKQISNQFIADPLSSVIVCDDYKTFFNSYSAYCPPVGFEIAFHVVLKGASSWDTLHSHLFLPINSSFSVLKDSLEEQWQHGFFEAWEKVISNKYKVNYSDVLHFAKEKNLHDYGLDFSFEKKSKRNFKFYWFVTEGSVLYRINPQSGAVKMKKMLSLKVPEDVSKGANSSFVQ
jgi:hypothetical protein